MREAVVVPLWRLPTKRLVVVAPEVLLTVSAEEDAYVRTEVEAASDHGEPVRWRSVVEALVPCPAYEPTVNGQAPLPIESAAQPNMPPLQVRTLPKLQVMSPFAKKADVEAVPDTVIAVEDAKGMVEKRPLPRMVVVAEPPTYSVSKTERRVDDALA